MKKIFQIVIISIITIFSFYYTQIIVNLVNSKDPIMQSIKDSNSGTKPVNGILSSDTMLVGSSGKKVDATESYQKMKTINTFNKELLEYENIKPEIIKANNLDKLLIGKNTNQKILSLVFEIEDLDNLKQIVYILNKNSVIATFFINNDLLRDNTFLIKKIIDNNYVGLHYDNDDFVGLKKYITTNFDNYANYCLYKDKSFLNICRLNRVNTIKPTIIDSNLFNYLTRNKNNGYIYEIKVNCNNIKQLNSTLIYLKQKDYKIIDINNLLRE